MLKHCSEISFEWILQLVSGVYETRGGFASAINDVVVDDIPAAKPPQAKMVYRAKGERNVEVDEKLKQDTGAAKLGQVVSGTVKISDMIADSLQRLF